MVRNTFLNQEIAEGYDNFYTSRMGSKIDNIEKHAIEVFLHRSGAELILQN